MRNNRLHTRQLERYLSMHTDDLKLIVRLMSAIYSAGNYSAAIDE